MKWLLLVLVLLLALVPSVVSISGADIKASILRYEPAPAEQGSTVDVWLQLNNVGTTADLVAVKFVSEYPFSLPANQPDTVAVGALAAQESKVVKFTVLVDQNAPNGDRTIKFLYQFSSRNEWVLLESPIALQTQNAALVIDEYAISPSPVVPGQTSVVELSLRNVGKMSVKNVDVSIELDDGKFSTLGSGTKKRIDYIGAGETARVKFQLASDTSTEVKLYNIPVKLSYVDERNKALSDSAKISLVVNAMPELSLSVDATKFEKKTRPGTVVVKIVNKGVVNVKYVTIIVNKSSEYDVLSPSSEAYVGNLDSDDFETVDFVIKPRVDNPVLNLVIEFKNPYNVAYSEEVVLPVRIITDADLGTSRFPWGMVAVVVLVVGGSVYYWRNSKRHK